jgi:SAM-dependent methyltransferase
MVFNGSYADAYDSLYRDKDYENECDFIEDIFRKHGCKPKTILDLGCGTGGHALILAKRGYKVTGVDRSDPMLAIAKKKANKAGFKIDFIQGDLTSLKLDRKFDAVISMFAVMSYLIANSDLAAVCKLAKDSLKNGGLFLFDCWHGPGVLTDKPTARVKEVSMKTGGKIIRFTEPELDIENHVVKVHFRVRKTKNSSIEETKETHVMRFLFPQEIRYFLEVARFHSVDFYPFLDIKGQLTEQDWNMTVIGR